MTCKNNFGADAPSQPIPVLKGWVCGRVSQINVRVLECRLGFKAKCDRVSGRKSVIAVA
jgi:hypothetical protein